MTHPALTSLSDEEKLFRDTVLGFARERIGPHVARMDEEAALDKSLLPALFEMGLMAIEVPTEHGGGGGTFFDAILAIEALAMVDPSVSVLVDVQNTLVLNAILRWGSDAQKQKYLPKMASSWVGSYALSEASSGSDAFALKARATRKDGGWVLNGRKLWITNAGESSIFLVLATVDPALGYKGITAFLVEREFAGFSVGKREHKLGIRASSTCELVLEDCFVPDENVLGEVGKGYKIAIETLNEGRIGIGAQMLGLAQGAFEYSVRYMNERKQFGQSIASFQGVQFQYARVAMEIEAARLMVYNAARLKVAGQPFLKEAAMAKLFASEVAERTASLAVEFLGGVGFTKEYPMEKLYRDAKIGKIYEGTSNLQLQTIAKLVQAELGGKLARALQGHSPSVEQRSASTDEAPVLEVATMAPWPASMPKKARAPGTIFDQSGGDEDEKPRGKARIVPWAVARSLSPFQPWPPPRKRRAPSVAMERKASKSAVGFQRKVPSTWRVEGETRATKPKVSPVSLAKPAA